MVWWICEKGHEWQAMVKSRVSGCGCPFCTNRALMPGENDLATNRPEIARQWHPDKNGGLFLGRTTEMRLPHLCRESKAGIDSAV